MRDCRIKIRVIDSTAIRGRTVTDVGTTDFHHEALKNTPGGVILGYVQASWKEVFN